MFSRLGTRRSGTRQYDLELGELARLRIYFDRTAMLLHDDVVTERKAETGPFTGGLRRKEGVEQLVSYLSRDAGAVVPYPDLHAVTEVFGRCGQSGLISIAVRLGLPLRRG